MTTAELGCGLELVAPVAQHLNIAVCVLTTEGQRAYVVHVRPVRGEAAQALVALGRAPALPMNGEDRNAQTQIALGPARRNHRGFNWSSVRVAGCEVDNREPASVPNFLDSPRRYRLCIRLRIIPSGPPVLVAGEIRVIPVRSGVECVNCHHQSLLSRKSSRVFRSSSANSAAFCAAIFSAWLSMSLRMATG